ncbi:MAG: glycosyltransferase family 2 protein [Methylococcales bacterium]|nr:glycosyltransferase family 2 protein [Methylococcales bacterium]
MTTCIVIPVYNHQGVIVSVIKQLKNFGLHCFLINDGSLTECTETLKQIAMHESDWVTLLERKQNGGKGAAVIDGFRLAINNGFSHAIQVDADGQHKLEDIQRFLGVSKQSPAALIIGQPLFDQSVPKKRLYGRQFTNQWIWINTLSFSIMDGMCGFRCYPLAAVDELLKATNIGQRMDFDIDIVVRLFWQGVEVINLPTDVQYPVNGVSHFNMLHDNLLISRIHAQLFFGMLLRFPKLLLRHFK